MKTSDFARGLPLASPMVCDNHFLDEPTQEMIEWYYGSPTVESICATNIDEHTMVIGIIETKGDKKIHRSFTIGKSIKKMICKNYLFYHPMENS